MNIMFGFEGRIGRLHYFLFSMLLLVAIVLLALVLAGLLIPTGDAARAAPSPLGRLVVIAAILVPLFLWFSFALQAKRFRDIGWNPLYVIPGWIAFTVLDKCASILFPAFALGAGKNLAVMGNGTVAGLAVNLVMGGCLLFWPGSPAGGEGRWDPRELEPRRPPPAPATIRPRPPTPTMPAPTGFGRRGL